MDHPSPTTLLVIVVGIVSFFPLALAVGTYAVGRSMRPAKRNDRQEALPG
jgi:Sec-independent protein translocase protein TatA